MVLHFKDTFEEAMVASEKVSFELDQMIQTTPASDASVLDIITASGTRTLTKEASAEDREAVGEVIIVVEGKSHFCYDFTGVLCQYFIQGGFGNSQGVF